MPLRASGTRWVWLPVVAMVGAYAASHFVQDPLARTWIQELLYGASLILAVIACASVSRKVPSAERRYWLALTLAGVAALVTDLIWAWWNIVLHVETGPPSPSVADITEFLVYVLLFVAIFSMTRLSDVPASTRLRQGLDVAALMVVAAIAVLILVVRPIYLSGTHTLLVDQLFDFSIPVLDIGALLALLLSVLTFKRSGWLPWESITAAAIIAIALGDLSYGWLSATGMYASGRLASDASDTFGILGFMLFYAAAMRRRIEPAGAPLPGGHAQRARSLDWADVLLPVIAPITMTGLIVWALTAHLDPFTYWIALGGAAVLAVLVVARIVVQAAENTRLLSRSVTDPLTGLFNHRFFHERLEVEISRAKRSAEPVSVALVDLDEFNTVNNVYGHVIGDRQLRWVATRLGEGVRACDTVCRIGGDEFGIIMPSTSLMDAFEVCVRLRLMLDRSSENLAHGTKVSIGLAEYPRHALSRDDLVRKADGALYWAKYHGRDQVVVYDTEVVQALGPEERIRRIEEQSYTRTVEALAAAVDARDSYTQDHSHNVAALAALLAPKLRIPETSVKLIEVAALLHDVGKIGIPDSILRKESNLTEDELAQVREHPSLGERILGATTFQEILPWVLSHHERWDGSGYPQKLAGEEIPVEARILAVCDAYDAMTSDRPYRSAMPRQAALDEIARCSGTQFDPAVVEAFLAVLSQTEPAEQPEPTGGAKRSNPTLDLSGNSPATSGTATAEQREWVSEHN